MNNFDFHKLWQRNSTNGNCQVLCLTNSAVAFSHHLSTLDAVFFSHWPISFPSISAFRNIQFGFLKSCNLFVVNQRVVIQTRFCTNARVLVRRHCLYIRFILCLRPGLPMCARCVWPTMHLCAFPIVLYQLRFIFANKTATIGNKWGRGQFLLLMCLCSCLFATRWCFTRVGFAVVSMLVFSAGNCSSATAISHYQMDRFHVHKWWQRKFAFGNWQSVCLASIFTTSSHKLLFGRNVLSHWHISFASISQFRRRRFRALDLYFSYCPPLGGHPWGYFFTPPLFVCPRLFTYDFFRICARVFERGANFVWPTMFLNGRHCFLQFMVHVCTRESNHW